MEDVKAVVTGMRIALAALTVILLIFTMININKGNKHLILQSFHNGGWGILGLIGAIMILLVISFNQLFTWFHQIFFESGTWRFYTSDTLIRLFPMRFWRDAFIFVGVLCILFGVITILVTRKYINLEKSK
jgi:integral membrane protein (TIGR01906 family)